LEDARFRQFLERKAFGVFSVKSYNQPKTGGKASRLLKQAYENEIEVVPEGAPLSSINVMILDGHTGIRNTIIPVANLSKDVCN